jgi:DNA polymerase/3'-5' exonuclease PolX
MDKLRKWELPGAPPPARWDRRRPALDAPPAKRPPVDPDRPLSLEPAVVGALVDLLPPLAADPSPNVSAEERPMRPVAEVEDFLDLRWDPECAPVPASESASVSLPTTAANTNKSGPPNARMAEAAVCRPRLAALEYPAALAPLRGASNRLNSLPPGPLLAQECGASADLTAAGGGGGGGGGAAESGALVSLDDVWRDEFERERLVAVMEHDQSGESSAGVNAFILDELELSMKRHERLGNQWNVLGYRKAMSSLRKYPKRIESVDDVRDLNFVGPNIQSKIREILATGKLRQAHEVAADEQVLLLFRGIWGAGIEKARYWYGVGYRTLEDIREKAELTSSQRIGLLYYNEFNMRIPREEQAEVERVISEEVRSMDADLVAVACGSYRRGAPTSGDMDFLISNRAGKSVDGLLQKIVRRLHARTLLTDDLTHPDGSSNKYFGVCQLRPNLPHRRIDLYVCPLEEFPYALLYFTGSGIWNRILRAYAKFKRRIKLHNAAMNFIYAQGNYGPPIPGMKSEEDILHYLGLQYVPPHLRTS